MKKQTDRNIRHRKLLIIWALLAVIMAAAITITGISILSSQIRTDREQAVTGAAKIAAKELGMLTKTFKVLTEHTKDNITALNKKAFVDALTHVKNKGAFTTFLNEFQEEIESGMARTDFALGVFDCDDLKSINDRFGHDKGDIYLETASRTICNIFSHSPVFRIGGDEFSVILRKEDYANRDSLIKQFEEVCEKINASTDNKWEQVRISMGFAEYEPSSDSDVSDIVRRADKMMYENKRMRKSPAQVI